jgi:hypothetical protein
MATLARKVRNGAKTLIFSFFDFALVLVRGKTYTASINSLNFKVELGFGSEVSGRGG